MWSSPQEAESKTVNLQTNHIKVSHHPVTRYRSSSADTPELSGKMHIPFLIITPRDLLPHHLKVHHLAYKVLQMLIVMMTILLLLSMTYQKSFC